MSTWGGGGDVNAHSGEDTFVILPDLNLWLRLTARTPNPSVGIVNFKSWVSDIADAGQF